jgi:predicted DNA-binding antitoxin AbrB/MazE fold protein
MTLRLQAVYEQGLLRPLEPLPFLENQQVTVTISEREDEAWRDASFPHYLESQADDSVSIDEVRTALFKIPGSLTEDFRQERDERN